MTVPLPPDLIIKILTYIPTDPLPKAQIKTPLEGYIFASRQVLFKECTEKPNTLLGRLSKAYPDLQVDQILKMAGSTLRLGRPLLGDGDISSEKELHELTYPEMNRLDVAIKNKEDQILCDFFDQIKQLRNEEGNLYIPENTLPDLYGQELPMQAEIIRKWMSDEENQAHLFAIDKLDDDNSLLPPERKMLMPLTQMSMHDAVVLYEQMKLGNFKALLPINNSAYKDKEYYACLLINLVDICTFEINRGNGCDTYERFLIELVSCDYVDEPFSKPVFYAILKMTEMERDDFIEVIASTHAYKEFSLKDLEFCLITAFLRRYANFHLLIENIDDDKAKELSEDVAESVLDYCTYDRDRSCPPIQNLQAVIDSPLFDKAPSSSLDDACQSAINYPEHFRLLISSRRAKDISIECLQGVLLEATSHNLAEITNLILSSSRAEELANSSFEFSIAFDSLVTDNSPEAFQVFIDSEWSNHLSPNTIEHAFSRAVENRRTEIVKSFINSGKADLFKQKYSTAIYEMFNEEAKES